MSVHGEHLLPPRLSGKDDAPRTCQKHRTSLAESPGFFRMKSDMRPDDLRPKSDLHLTTGDLLQDLRVVLVLGRVDARLEIVYRIVW